MNMFIRIPEEFYDRTRQIIPPFISESILQNIKPPTYIPDKNKAIKLKKGPAIPGATNLFGAVDAPNIANCLYQFVFLYPTNQQPFWIILTYVGPQSIGGYTMVENYWSYQGIALQNVDSFWCDPTVVPGLMGSSPFSLPRQMARHEILIKKVHYQEPYSKTCYQDVLGQQVPYPCFGTQPKTIEIYLETTYPADATPAQKAAIISCSQETFKFASNAYAAASQTAGTAGGVAGIGGLAEVVAGIAAAEVAGRTYFNKCKQKSLPPNIANRTSIGIIRKSQ